MTNQERDVLENSIQGMYVSMYKNNDHKSNETDWVYISKPQGISVSLSDRLKNIWYT